MVGHIPPLAYTLRFAGLTATISATLCAGDCDKSEQQSAMNCGHRSTALSDLQMSFWGKVWAQSAIRDTWNIQRIFAKAVMFLRSQVNKIVLLCRLEAGLASLKTSSSGADLL